MGKHLLGLFQPRLFLLFLLLAALVPSGKCLSEMTARALTVNGTYRIYYSYASEKARKTRSPSPLVVVLHGGLGTVEQMVRWTRFNAIAEKENFYVLYPAGHHMLWNDGRVFDGRTETTEDDVAFLRAAIEDFDRNLATVDRRQIYGVGMSNGGFMMMRAACEASELFAGVAAVTATIPNDVALGCRPTAPLAVLLINGTADPIVPYSGGTVRGPFNEDRGRIWSTEATVAFWARHNGCVSPNISVLERTNSAKGLYAIQFAYSKCRGRRVKLIRIEGGGHAWPGGPQYLPQGWVGKVDPDLNASALIWEFFKSARSAE